MDQLAYLKHTKNLIIGNSSAKVALRNASDTDGPVLQSIITFLEVSDAGPKEASSSTGRNAQTDQCRIEAANIIASLAHGELPSNALSGPTLKDLAAEGPRDAVLGLLQANIPLTLLKCLTKLECTDTKPVRVAIVRALRAVYVAAADCVGPSVWGLGEDCRDFRDELRATLDYMFQDQALDVVLPLLEDPVNMIRLYVAQLLAFAIRLPRHGAAVTEWLPVDERTKEIKGKRGWEVEALIDANSPKRLGGWVIRHLSTMLDVKDVAMREAALYAIATLVKENKAIALVLEQPTPRDPPRSVLEMASDHSKDRKPEVRIAACLCVTNIVRTHPVHVNRRLPNTTIHVLTAIIQDENETDTNRMKACHILGSLVADDAERCVDAWNFQTLTKIADLFKSITPSVRPQEWDDGEPLIVSQLREASLCAIASLALLDDNIRNEIAGTLALLPAITTSLQHPYAGVRYGACQCVRALSRSIRVLRTSLLDSGMGMLMCEIVESQTEDRRVTNIALAGLCNLLNDFSPLRQAMLDRGMVTRIAELSRYPEDTLRVSALWAVKNLMNKATTEEKASVMAQLNWDHFKECLQSTNFDIQEQAISIVVNIATSIEDIAFVFKHIPIEFLIHIFESALETMHEGLITEVLRALGNISNGPDEYISYITSSQILTSLRSCITHSNMSVRKYAVDFVEQLAAKSRAECKAAGLDEALRQILKEHAGVNTMRENFAGTRRRTTSIGVAAAAIALPASEELSSEVRERARTALQEIEGRLY